MAEDMAGSEKKRWKVLAYSSKKDDNFYEQLGGNTTKTLETKYVTSSVW